MEKKKILFLITEDWFFNSHFLDRALAAKKKGYRILICCNLNKHKLLLDKKGFESFHIGFDRKNINFLFEIKVILKIFFIYKKIRPDIVHHVAAKPIIYGSLAARLNNIKSVINAPVGLGYVFSSSSIKAKLLKPLVKLLYKIFLNRHKGMDKKNKVVFENYDDLNYFSSIGALDPKDACVIRGAGVKIKYKLINQKVQNKIPVITFLARMLKDKGVYEFVEAVNKLKNNNIEGRFLLAGDVDPLNPSSVEINDLKNWHNEGNVEWLGWVNNVDQLLKKTDIVCLPSYREGLPKALLEGAAHGLPIVTTDAVGCKDVVLDGINGFLVPIKNSEKLYEALKKLIQNKKLRIKMGKESLKIVSDKFESSKIILQTLNLYKEME